MANFFKNYRTELIIFSAIFLIRVAYALLLQIGFGSDVFISYLDAKVFLREARNILDHGVMSQFPDPPFLPDPLRTPLYLWFLAFLLWLRVPLFGIVVFQNALSGLMGVMSYRLGKLFFSNWAGIMAAGFFALEPISIYWNNLLMSDNLFSFLLVLAIYFFMTRKLYWASAALALATLTRPVGLYLFLVFLLTAFMRQQLEHVGWMSIGKKLAIMAVIFTAIIFPWMLRNKVLFNTWELSSAGWLNLYIFTVKEFAVQKGIEMPMPVVPEDYHPNPYRWVFYNYEFSSMNFFKKHTIDLVSKYPLDYLWFHFISGLRGLNNHDYYYLVDYVVIPKVFGFSRTLGYVLAGAGQAFWWLMYGGMALGLVFERNRFWSLFLIGLLVFNALLIGYNGLFSSGSRYLMPFTPLVLLAGIYGLTSSYIKYVKGR